MSTADLPAQASVGPALPSVGAGPVAATPASRSAGFTLIELLMVLTVVAILMGMLMPMYSIVNSWTIKSRTQYVLKKVDTALRLFRADLGVYPYARRYPDDARDLLGVAANELYYRIGQGISADDAALVRKDMARAAEAFGYRWWSNTTNIWGGHIVESPVGQPSSINFRNATASGPYSARFAGESNQDGHVAAGTGANRPGVPIMLNRMAQERVRLAVLAGDVDVRGPIVCTPDDRNVTIDHTGTRVLSAPESGARPGWAKDYLAGDIERRYIRGDTILDGWKRPLVYVCQSTPGVIGDGAYVGRHLLVPFDSRFFGLGPAGFDPTTGPGPSLLRSRPLLLTSGRVRLSRSDAGDGLGPTPTHADHFPDAGDLMSSDVRYYAAPGYETEFELWSPGRDGRFSYRRGDADNADNLGAALYLKGLK